MRVSLIPCISVRRAHAHALAKATVTFYSFESAILHGM